MRSPIRLLLLIAVLALVAAACSDDSEPTDDTSTTTTVADAGTASDEDLVFGSGVLPETVPDDFPFPDQAQIGSTLVDRTRGLTEFIATYPANVVDVVAFFETNLPTFGYDIGPSDGSDGAWVMEFTRGDLSGELTLDTAGPGLTQGTIVILQPSG